LADRLVDRYIYVVVVVVGMWLMCPDPNCNYVWDYKGRLQTATCPSCHRNVPVQKNKTFPPEESGG